MSLANPGTTFWTKYVFEFIFCYLNCPSFKLNWNIFYLYCFLINAFTNLYFVLVLLLQTGIVSLDHLQQSWNFIVKIYCNFISLFFFQCQYFFLYYIQYNLYIHNYCFTRNFIKINALAGIQTQDLPDHNLEFLTL